MHLEIEVFFVLNVTFPDNVGLDTDARHVPVLSVIVIYFPSKLKSNFKRTFDD